MKKDEVYKCPTCHQIAPKPAWKRARDRGFDQFKDCLILANNIGKVTSCWGVRKLGHPCCDDRCPIHKHFVIKKPCGLGGRLMDIFEDPLKDRKYL